MGRIVKALALSAGLLALALGGAHAQKQVGIGFQSV